MRPPLNVAHQGSGAALRSSPLLRKRGAQQERGLRRRELEAAVAQRHARGDVKGAAVKRQGESRLPRVPLAYGGSPQRARERGWPLAC